MGPKVRVADPPEFTFSLQNEHQSRVCVWGGGVFTESNPKDLNRAFIIAL